MSPLVSAILSADGIKAGVWDTMEVYLRGTFMESLIASRYNVAFAAEKSVMDM